MIHKHNNFGKPVVYKSLGLDIKADEDSRTVSGYLAAFGNKDSDKDIIVKGAFAKSIAERGVDSSTHRKIAFLWMHNMNEPIGKFTELKEDDKGLFFKAQIDEIPLGDRVLTQYKSGTLNQHSIGFRYDWDKIEHDEEQDAYIVKELNLFEGSVVTLGANENTPFTGFKSDKLEDERKILDRDFETFTKHLSNEESYKVRQFVSNYIEINKQPGKPTVKEPEQSTQINEFYKHLNI